MPKAKPDKVVVHRIELQKTEREILEGVAMATGVGNLAEGAGAILSGVGAMMAPFGKALAAIIAAYVAKEGVEDILGWAARKTGEKNRRIDAEYAAYLATKAAAESATRPDGTLLNPGPHDPPMSRREYEIIHGRANMTNWERLMYDLSGGLTSPDEVNDMTELNSRKNQVCDAMMAAHLRFPAPGATEESARRAAEAAGYCAPGGGDW
jgi:hypothetical protein